MKNNLELSAPGLRYLSVLVFLTASLLAGCALVAATPEPLPSSAETEILLYPGGNAIAPAAEDRSEFVANILGAEYLKFPSSTVFYWVETRAGEVMASLDDRLSADGWQVQTDWGHRNSLILGTWKKGDLELSILMLDDLDAVGIDSLAKNYGITGPVPGSTLLVMHMRDLAAGSP
jgi:hypothetical protein